MKIGFDISDLSTDRADGTTRYTRELAARLPLLAPEHDWVYFAPLSSSLIETLAARLPQVTMAISPWPKYWTQMRLPFELYTHQPDVLFMPIQQIPFLRPRHMRTVAVVHDLAVHKFPQQFTRKDWALLHVFSAYAARSANSIISVSHATARDIACYYGRTRGVQVVHHGVDQEKFHAPAGPELNQSWQALQHTYAALRKPYVLYVGQIQPRKNLIRLIEAFEQLQGNFAGQLVIAGGHGWLQKEIEGKLNNSPARATILKLGRVPDALLPALYWHAETCVLPSLYEGFGMPILEAMASGSPVVTASVSAMPEVAGTAAVLIDPNSSSSIAAGIKQAMSKKSELAQKGMRHARQFTWEACAAQTIKVLLQS